MGRESTYTNVLHRNFVLEGFYASPSTFNMRTLTYTELGLFKANCKQAYAGVVRPTEKRCNSYVLNLLLVQFEISEIES